MSFLQKFLDRVLRTNPSRMPRTGFDDLSQDQLDAHLKVGRYGNFTLTEAVRKVPTPALIICGDEDDNCVEPSLFLKKHLPAAGLSFFPKSGHVLNLEEPALFNEMVERFIALVEAGRWPVRDPRSMMAG